MESSEIGVGVNDENFDEDLEGPPPDQLWRWYTEVERRFIEYCDYVPLKEKHYEVWSFKLASILFEVCSILDSFFKAGSSWLFNYPEFDSSEFTKEKERIKANETNICIWRKIYERFYNFGEKEIHVIPLRKPIRPFKEWKTKNGLESQHGWWKAYNAIKHDRFRRLEEASLGTTLFALAGVFLAIVVHVPIKPYLFDMGIIEFRGLVDPRTSYQCRDMLLRKEPAVIYRDNSIIGSTPLFSYEFQKTGHSDYIPIGGSLTGEFGWPTDKIWPECQQECVGKKFDSCYRNRSEIVSILRSAKSPYKSRF